MATYLADLLWERDEQTFTDNQYRRAHVWRFDGGLEIPASASPSVVPLPLSNAAAVDPEEAFVAALASCHMLWFLSIAAQGNWCVDRYRDRAQGVMAKNGAGDLAITRVTLHPQVAFSGARMPTVSQQEQMHAQAHRRCFIANSVKSEVRCKPVYAST